MDPLGVTSLLLASIDKVKSLSDQIHANESGLVSLTRETDANLAQVKEVLATVQTRNVSIPEGLQRDLDRIQRSLETSATELASLASCSKEKRTTLLIKVAYQAKRIKNADKVTEALSTVNRETQTLLRRFSTKWSALMRLETAECTHLLDSHRSSTKEEWSKLKGAVHQLGQELKSCAPSKRPNRPPALSRQRASPYSASSYLIYRLTQIEAAFAEFGIPEQVEQAYHNLPCALPPRPVPCKATAPPPTDDECIDSLVSVIQAVRTPQPCIQGIFTALHHAAHVLGACMFQEEAVRLVHNGLHFCRSLTISSPNRRSWLASLCILQARQQHAMGLVQEKEGIALATEGTALLRALIEEGHAMLQPELDMALGWLQDVQRHPRKLDQPSDG